jgi:zinc/manganese transport system permease protein
LVTVWVALFIAYYSPYPIGFWLTTIAFGLYAVTAVSGVALRRLGARVHFPAEAPV